MTNLFCSLTLLQPLLFSSYVEGVNRRDEGGVKQGERRDEGWLKQGSKGVNGDFVGMVFILGSDFRQNIKTRGLDTIVVHNFSKMI